MSAPGKKDLKQRHRRAQKNNSYHKSMIDGDPLTGLADLA